MGKSFFSAVRGRMQKNITSTPRFWQIAGRRRQENLHTPQMPSVTSFFTEKNCKTGRREQKNLYTPRRQESGKNFKQKTRIRKKPEARNRNPEKKQRKKQESGKNPKQKTGIRKNLKYSM